MPLTAEQLAKVQPELTALADAIAALYAPAVVVPPVVVPVVPTSTGTFTVTLISAAADKSAVVSADNGIIKDQTKIQFSNGRTSVVTSVVLDGVNMRITTGEPAADSAAALARLAGTVATVKDRYDAPATTVPPVVVAPPVVASQPLVGVNISGLGSNPYVQNAVIGTHYRDVEPKYLDKYDALGCKLYRVPLAVERLVRTNKGALVVSVVAEITAVLDRLAAKGAKGILDPHCYMRYFTTVDAGAANPTGADEHTFQGVRKLHLPIGAPGCTLDSDGYADFLSKLSAAFSGHPGVLGIGLANEPYTRTEDKFDVNAAYLANAQKYVDAIRSASKTVKTFVGGAQFCTAINWPTVSDSLKNIVDPDGQVIYEAHQYLDGKMYGGGSWSNPSEVIPVDNFVNMTKPFVDWLILNGKRGFLGEHGHPAGNVSASAATAKGIQYLIANKVMSAQWCAGPGWPANDVNGMDTDDLKYKDNLDAIKPYFGARG